MIINNKSDRKNSSHKNHIKYLTFGSPMIDEIVYVDKDFIKKYNLKLDTTMHAEEDNRIFEVIGELQPFYAPGGCSYNAIRIFNWILKDTDEFRYTGCLGSVGKDKHGELYEKILSNESIIPYFEYINGKKTAKCATICQGRERCHMTHLGASTYISEEYVNKHWNDLKNIKLIYTELYILSHKIIILEKLAKLCLDDDKLFGFNLPSLGFLDAFTKEIIDMITYGDIIFANKEEAKHLADLLKFEYADISEIAAKLAMLPKKNNKKKRVFVVTCGPDPAYVAVYNHNEQKIEVSESYIPYFIPLSYILDTNGAGDSFAGAFLAYYLLGKSIESCMKIGHWAAAQTIQKEGFSLDFEAPVPKEVELYKNDFKAYIEDNDEDL